MIRIAICDDEIKQRYLLRKTVEKELNTMNIGSTLSEFGSGEALLASDICSYDLIFLDIEMKALNGIDTAKEIRKQNDIVNLVFVTGFTDYVFDGYEVNALNYIMKPFKEEKIKVVLETALKNIEQLQDDCYLLACDKGTYKIPWTSIVYFASDKRKIHVYTKNDTYEFYGKLNVLEEMVPPAFIRIHRRYLVNIIHARGIEDSELLIQNSRLPVSRQRMKEVMILFAKTMLG